MLVFFVPKLYVCRHNCGPEISGAKVLPPLSPSTFCIRVKEDGWQETKQSASCCRLLLLSMMGFFVMLSWSSVVTETARGWNNEGRKEERKKEPQCHLQRKAFFSAPDEESFESDSTHGMYQMYLWVKAQFPYCGMVCCCPVSPVEPCISASGLSASCFSSGKLMQSCKRQWYPLRFAPFLPSLGLILGPCTLVSC